MNAHRPPEGGVTLIELMVAVTITLGLAALVLTVTNGTLSLWHRAQDAFTTDTQAKLVLDFLQRDFDAALFRDDGGTWLAVDVNTARAPLANHGWRIAGVTKPQTAISLDLLPVAEDGGVLPVAAARFGVGGAWLRFMTTNVETKSSGNPGGSQPVAISYQIARRPISGPVSASNPAAVRYTLFRSAVANDLTFTTGYDVLLNGYGSSTSAAPGARSARSLTNPNIADAIASNVIDLGLWLYVQDVTGSLQRVFPATRLDTVHRAVTRSDFPDVAEVMVRVLTEEGARAIESIESGNSGRSRPAGMTEDEWWWSVAAVHSRVYVRRFQLRGGAW